MVTATRFAEIMGLAAHWISLHPEMHDSIRRARHLVDRIREVDRYSYAVPASKPGQWYSVIVLGDRSTCTCYRSAVKGEHCKHRLAVGLLVMLKHRASRKGRVYQTTLAA